MAVVRHRVADQDEDNTGHKGLAHLQQAWSSSHVTCHLPWPRFSQAHLPHVGYRCQAGEDGGHDAIVANLAMGPLFLEEKKWEDDRGREAEEGGVAGDSDGEIGPGHWDSGLEAELLHQQDQQGAGEAERPAEDAPVSHASVKQWGSVCCDTERHTGEQQGSYTHP